MTEKRFIEVHAEPVIIPDAAPARRVPIRPLKYRDEDFDAKFDHDTLFYDVFPNADGDILASGPPLWNLKNEVAFAEVRAGGVALPDMPTVVEFDRCSVSTLAKAQGAATSLQMDVLEQSFDLALSPNYCDALAGRRVLMTMSKDNDPAWIRAWVSHYIAGHGADSVVFFDNGSSAFGFADVVAALEDLDGLEQFYFVHWPFKYGPQGGKARFWDSDFCQVAAWQTARWRFLSKASSVLNVDIDELLLPDDDGRSIFDAVEASETGYIAFPGRWIEAVKEDYVAGRLPRHDDFLQYVIDAPACNMKWAVCPAKCKDEHQWMVHKIRWMKSEKNHSFLFRHFKAINTGWKDQRHQPRTFKPEDLAVDDALAAWFNPESAREMPAKQSQVDVAIIMPVWGQGS
ncbi:MAG: hypothetical protein AAFV27_07155, partial [Pseudomonadota bacterium]